MDINWFSPDEESWHVELAYNPQVAVALRCAYECFTKNAGDGEVYADALKCLEPMAEASMSQHQRLAFLFIVSLALASQDPPTQALEPVDRSLELALELGVESAQLDLLLLRASVNRYVLEVPEAAEDLQMCLELFAAYSQHRSLTPTELDTRLEAVLHLAGSEFLIGHIESAELLLQQATILIPQVPHNHTAPFLLAWTRALLLRWQGQYELALTQAMTAADGYSKHGAPGATSRIQGLVAEIAMDLAQRAQHNDQELAPYAFLDIAERYLQRAIEVAAAANFESSQSMAFISQTRLHQLQHVPGDHTGWLRELADRGWQHDDTALVAQAYTQLGREAEGEGDSEAATKWYTETLDVLRKSHMTALGVWAQRGLWRIQGEMG